MPSAETIFLIVYFAILVVLSVFAWHMFYVIYLYFRFRGNAPRDASPLRPLPIVTVQLPIYNEVYVVDRLLDAIGRLDYPRELLEIQVLDDSTDETREIAQSAVRRLAARGIDIKYLHRTDRAGFKAGALQAGLAAAKGEFIAIFDADFVPAPDFLRRMLPHFAHPGVGMVQSRWAHLNGQYSLLTKIQALMLDAHFTFDQGGRSRAGRFFHFNGTAGIWRREAIVDAGGWSFDTLTEDVDLSYRAQLRGWRFVFLPDVVSPAEVPMEINAFKSQQRRWSKGNVQVCCKLLPRVLRAKIPLADKVEAAFYMTSSFCFPLVLALSILMFPAMTILATIGNLTWPKIVLLNILFLSSTFSALSFCVLSQRLLHRDWKRRLTCLPVLFAVSIGISVNNARAVLEALLRVPNVFVRTPKYGGLAGAGSAGLSDRKYRQTMAVQPLVELAMAAYFTAAEIYSLSNGLYIAALSLALFQVGFLYMGVLSLLQQRAPKPVQVAAGAASTERREADSIS